MKRFLALSLSDVVFIMLINVKMPTIVGILTFMSRINFVLSRVEHEKSLSPQDLVYIIGDLHEFLVFFWVSFMRLFYQLIGSSSPTVRLGYYRLLISC